MDNAIKKILALRLQWVWGVVLIILAIQLFLSKHLWFVTPERHFPVLPLWEAFPLRLGLGQDYVQWICFFVCAIGSFFVHKTQLRGILRTIALGLFILAGLQDVMRIQAWTYQYTLVLMLFCWEGWAPTRSKASFVRAMQWMLALTYIWSGLHKLNPQFAAHVYPWLMGIFPQTEAYADTTFWAYAMGVGEALLGILLIWPKTQRFTWPIAIAFHLLLLTLLIKDHWNPIVWPWNIVMLCWIALVFPKVKLEAYRTRPLYLVWFWVGFAPWLGVWGFWAYNMSMTMYSGLATEARLVYHLNEAEHIPDCLPNVVHTHAYPIGAQSYEVLLDDWSMEELQVPLFAEEFVLQRLGQYFCGCSARVSAYRITTFSRWSLSLQDKRRFTCPQ